MTELSLALPLAVGELIYARASLDAVKRQYRTIRINLAWQWLGERDTGYTPFVESLARLLYSEPPYVFDKTTVAD